MYQIWQYDKYPIRGTWYMISDLLTYRRSSLPIYYTYSYLYRVPTTSSIDYYYSC